MGPALDVRGGVSTVEQLICDYLPSYASIRHVPTMTEGTKLERAAVFARAIHTLSARKGGWLKPDALIVVEEAADAGFKPPEGFTELERRSYDDTEFVFLRAT